MRERLAGVMPSVWPAVPGALPATMRAVVFRRFGGPEVLEVGELPVPPVGEREVMIRVAAVSVGRLVDLTARAGTHPYPRFVLPHALGAEHAGTVVAATGRQHGPRRADHRLRRGLGVTDAAERERNPR